MGVQSRNRCCLRIDSLRDLGNLPPGDDPVLLTEGHTVAPQIERPIPGGLLVEEDFEWCAGVDLVEVVGVEPVPVEYQA